MVGSRTRLRQPRPGDRISPEICSFGILSRSRAGNCNGSRVIRDGQSGKFRPPLKRFPPCSSCRARCSPRSNPAFFASLNREISARLPETYQKTSRSPPVFSPPLHQFDSEFQKKRGFSGGGIRPQRFFLGCQRKNGLFLKRNGAPPQNWDSALDSCAPANSLHNIPTVQIPDQPSGRPSRLHSERYQPKRRHDVGSALQAGVIS